MIPILIGAISALLIVIAFFLSDTFRLPRRLKNTPRTPIGALTDGTTAKIVGRVVAVGPPLIAPVSRRECVYYHAGVSGEARGFSEAQSVHFEIEDETGRAYVPIGIPLGTKNVFLLKASFHAATGPGRDATPDLNLFLLKHGVDSQGLLLNRGLQYSEAALQPGMTVAVLGRVDFERPRAGMAAGYRDGQRVIVMRAAPGKKLIASDAPQAVGATA